jgi:phosphoribosylformylglycinamidine (FGAM) synthase-like enzyme
MSAKGKVGMRIDLDKVAYPSKEYEKHGNWLLSESQERMLIVVEKEKIAARIKKFSINGICL